MSPEQRPVPAEDVAGGPSRVAEVVPAGNAVAAPPLRRIAAFGLFLALFSFYMLTTSRERPWGDGTPIYEVAESIVSRGAFDIPTRWPAVAPLGRDGKIYAVAGLFQSLVHVPGVVLTKALIAIDPTRALQWRALMSHVGPSAIAAALVLLVYGFARERWGRSAALGIAALLAFGTTIWVYARYPYSEIVQALSFTGLFVELVRLGEAPLRRHAVAAGLWCGVLVNMKLAFLLAAPGAIVYVFWTLRARPRQAATLLLWAALAAAPLLAVIPIYNHLRWGDAFSTGYGSIEDVKGSVVFGLWGMFLSPGKSVFLYSPPLLLVLVALPRVWRQWPRYLTLLALVALPPLALHAKFPFWSGDWAWGTRYAVFTVPVLLLPAGLLIRDWTSGSERSLRWSRRLRLGGLAVVLAAGVTVQVLGSMFYWDTFIRIVYQAGTQWLGTPSIALKGRGQITGAFAELHRLQWLPPFSAVPGHFWMVRHVPFGDSWPAAEADAPWRAYTEFHLDASEGYARARVDWWFLEFGKRHLPVGLGLLAFFVVGIAAGVALFHRDARDGSA